MLEILNQGGILAGVAGSIALVIASFRTRTSQIWQESAKAWREEAEAQKTRADRLIAELEEVKKRLTDLETYTKTLVNILSTVDSQRLTELRDFRGL